MFRRTAQGSFFIVPRDDPLGNRLLRAALPIEGQLPPAGFCFSRRWRNKQTRQFWKLVGHR